MITIPRHQPAFANKVAQYLGVKKGDIFLDCTLGDGGHSQEALESGAQVISVDVDEESICRAKSFIPLSLQVSWQVYRENFANLKDLFDRESLPRPDIVLMDLGTSQYQLAAGERGFSFQSDAPLDMRLDNRLQVTAADLINALPESELADMFYQLSDEVASRQIARAIVRERSRSKIVSTRQLADLIRLVKRQPSKIHPATKVFQALRMAVNLERESLRLGLLSAFELLKPGGRMGVITFHSGEDRIVKHFFHDQVDSDRAFHISQKPIKPELSELQINPKIRSAKLRLIQKS